ncbi:unnamed protein product [Paramecium pentaurelia]|uniref:Beta/gamma crystallin 'Greek key' domain-containing protein n=1 Tax=Paramecium pentaurelia TaxID=43138 RepID=A0A8S1VK25_9CILI|nr:unnamed protein product [Paramecium pentaurelia]
MKAIFLISLFTLVLNFRHPQYDTGFKVIVSSYTGHILESQSAVPRQIVHDIQFSKVFEIAPQIFIQPSLLDWSIGTPNGFIERVSFITTKGFKISGIAVTPSPIYTLYFYWLAINDNRVSVIIFDTWDLLELTTGTGQREVPFKLEHNLKDVTNGIISLTGIKHSAYNPIVELKIGQITSQFVTISVGSYSLSKLEYVRFNVLLGTDQSLWASSQFALINAPNHPFVSRPHSSYSLYMKIDFPSGFDNYQLIPLVTFRGYDVERSYNFRLVFADVLLNTKLQFTLATWADSMIYGVHYQTGIYLYDSNYKIFDQNCAELYSECNFQGDSFIVCDQIPNLLVQGWSKLIRSVTVPNLKNIFLFKMENYSGEKTTITENQKCMESTNVLSAKFKPISSFIKILFLNTNNCLNVKFYSQCNYQGTLFQITKGEQLKLSRKIPFEIQSIEICPNTIVKFKDPKYFGAAIQEFTTSQSCINSYKFPRYREQI